MELINIAVLPHDSLTLPRKLLGGFQVLAGLARIAIWGGKEEG
jgi:hypothetical protein